MTPSFNARSYIHIDQFQADITDVCGHFNVNPARRNGPFNGRIGLERLGGLEVASIGLDADCVVRDHRDIRTERYGVAPGDAASPAPDASN